MSEKKWYEYEAVALSFFYFVHGVYDWPYLVWVWYDGRVTLDFGCIIKCGVEAEGEKEP